MHGDNSYRLREFLKKVRNSSVDYDDHWIEKLVKALPKSNETNDVLIESLKLGADGLANQSNFYFIHLSLIREIVSSGDKDLWDRDFIKDVVRQFLSCSTFDGFAVVMNALFMLYCELEEKNFSYEDEEVVQKAFQLLNDNIDSALNITICNYLDKIFGRKYNSCWASAIVELLKKSSSGSPDKYAGSSAWRKRLSQLLLHDPSVITIEQSREIFILAKSLENRTEHINVSECEIVSINFHFCKLLSELVQQKKVDEKIFLDEDWCCVHIRNEILLQIIALGRTDLSKLVWDTPNLRLLDLVELGNHSDKADYLDRGLAILCEERNALSASKFIVSLKDPSIAVLDSLYDTLELHNMINPMVLNALLQKSEMWNNKIIPILASKATELLDLPGWECRDNALNQLTVLVNYGYNGSKLVQRITDMVKNDEEPYVRGEALVFLNQIGNRVDVNNVAASVVLLDSDSAPRIEAVRILRNGLPQTEMLCLDLIPKILYDEDIALHRTIIDLCTALVTNGRNQELKELLIKFLEDEVDCYEELNEMLYGRNKGLSLKHKGDDDLEYIFNVLAKQSEEDVDKDCYDL